MKPTHEVVLRDAEGKVVHVYKFFSSRAAWAHASNLNASVAAFVGGARAFVREAKDEEPP